MLCKKKCRGEFCLTLHIVRISSANREIGQSNMPLFLYVFFSYRDLCAGEHCVHDSFDARGNDQISCSGCGN